MERFVLMSPPSCQGWSLFVGACLTPLSAIPQRNSTVITTKVRDFPLVGELSSTRELGSG